MYRNRRSLYVSLAGASVVGWFLAGCSSGASVTVNVSVPRPLVEPIDAAVGIYYNDELRNYVHEEELVGHGVYRIDIGASHAPVFAQVFDAMFETVVPVARVVGDDDTDAEVTDSGTEGDDDDAASAPPPVRFTRPDGTLPAVAGIIAPSIEMVQFAIPKQTGGEFYEVWIRYRLDLYDMDGNRLGEYPVIGYGKANEANFGGLGQASPALNAATIWALRDAAAMLSFQFRNEAQSQDWLAMIDNTKARAATAEQAVQ